VYRPVTLPDVSCTAKFNLGSANAECLATHIKNTLEESSLGATCKAERCALEIDNERVLVSLYTSLLERTACKSDHQKKVLVWHRGNGWTKEDDIELHISATEVWGWS